MECMQSAKEKKYVKVLFTRKGGCTEYRFTFCVPVLEGTTNGEIPYGGIFIRLGVKIVPPDQSQGSHGR